MKMWNWCGMPFCIDCMYFWCILCHLITQNKQSKNTQFFSNFRFLVEISWYTTLRHKWKKWIICLVSQQIDLNLIIYVSEFVCKGVCIHRMSYNAILYILHIIFQSQYLYQLISMRKRPYKKLIVSALLFFVNSICIPVTQTFFHTSSRYFVIISLYNIQRR
jgi:hypothetical protein